jgi:hypothetical protein
MYYDICLCVCLSENESVHNKGCNTFLLKEHITYAEILNQSRNFRDSGCILKTTPRNSTCNNLSRNQNDYIKINSVASIRVRTIPTQRPPLVGEVSVNFCG